MHLPTAILTALASLALAAPLLAVQDAKETTRPALETLNLGKRSLALQGYDPVAYFPEGGGKPKKGDKRITATHRGVTYRFTNEANRERFLAAPVRYEPAFGGWCAYAMADDDRVEIDPKSFLIQDGELLVFYDGFFADTRKQWRKGDVDAQKRRAETNWRRHHGHADRDLAQLALTDGLALGGHDPVAYRDAKPSAAKGKDSVTHVYRGVTYRFRDAASRTRFLADPAGHEPRVGGWDPLALAQGTRTAGDPTLFLVHDGGLYLFADATSRDAFAKDPAAAATRAEAAFRGR